MCWPANERLLFLLGASASLRFKEKYAMGETPMIQIVAPSLYRAITLSRRHFITLSFCCSNADVAAFAFENSVFRLGRDASDQERRPAFDFLENAGQVFTDDSE